MSIETIILGPCLLKTVLPPIQEVQRLVHEQTNVTLSEDRIIWIQLLSTEPEVLARSIVYSLTGDPACLSEPGDDETESRSAVHRLTGLAQSLAASGSNQSRANGSH